MPGRVRFIDHGGVQILYLDFTGIRDVASAQDAVEEAKEIVTAQPEGSLLTLTDVTGAESSPAIAKVLYELARHNKPWVRASAVVGAGGEEEKVFLLVRDMSRRKLTAFTTSDAAKDWLVEQARAT